ncbi:Methionyl-tRNA formyltransferase [Nocardia amikacinitolerans]|nr:Methionyl-tRNA formyltransferase [Nocardia amikacinitolerans]
MRRQILLMCSAENGLTVRAALALRRRGYLVRTAVVETESDMDRAAASGVDMIVCTYLTRRIPRRICAGAVPVVIVHPGPIGDRGPSSLDWAITDREPYWGVTVLSAVEDLDAGPVWAWRTFPFDAHRRKSTLYGTVVADAAIECVLTAVSRALDTDFVPFDQQEVPRAIPHARSRSAMRQADRAFDWSDDAEAIAHRVRAADGAPGVRTVLADRSVYLYDAKPGRRGPLDADPGTLVGRRHHAIEIACGSGTLWVGHLRAAGEAESTCKGPALGVLARTGIRPATIPVTTDPARPGDIHYRADGAVGVITIDPYNGALTTEQCHRLAAAIEFAAAQDTEVLILRGGAGPFFSTGIHLGAIEFAADPAAEGWANIRAMNSVCRALLLCADQLTIAAVTGNVGAGGMMLALAADVVVARESATVNAHYKSLGLSGSEFHTLTLPRRVGPAVAERLLDDGEPIDTATALSLGLLDEIGPIGRGFDDWLDDLARSYAEPTAWTRIMSAKRTRLDDGDRALIDAHERGELARMRADLYGADFATRRRAFLAKRIRTARPVSR